MVLHTQLRLLRLQVRSSLAIPSHATREARSSHENRAACFQRDVRLALRHTRAISRLLSQRTTMGCPEQHTSELQRVRVLARGRDAPSQRACYSELALCHAMSLEIQI
jgi:hypothetical protein